MSGPKDHYDEPALDRAAIYRGPQAPVLQAYVPLPVFGIECMVLLLCGRLIGLWTLVIVPLHFILVAKTSENPYWVRDLIANFNHRWFASNKNQFGQGVVTFTPHTTKRDLK